MSQIIDLVTRLEAATLAYYNGLPLMSDSAFDLLRDELVKLDPSHPFLKRVGAAPLAGGGWPKVKHEIPMGSQNKAQSEVELTDWVGKVPVANRLFTVTEKMDGISLELSYLNGKLVRGATRGDGEIGEDITRNVMLMQGVVRQLPATFLVGGVPIPMPVKVNVRAEIVVTHTDFEQFFKGDSNPRNSASGTAKRQSDPAKCKYLTAVAYQLILEGNACVSKAQELRLLASLGFKVVGWHHDLDQQGVQAVYDEYVKTKRDALDYDIDGLIIEVQDRDAREAMGVHDGRPKGSVAYKFPHEAKATILRAIRWQVGSSGRLTPVAEFDPVNLAGANVKQASLHNISYIDELARQAGQQVLVVGDKILVSRRNDVIPYVEEVLEAVDYDGDENDPNVFHTPKVCPVCGSALQRDGEYLMCSGKDACPAQVIGTIRRWIQKIGVKHFGDSLVELLCESGRVKTIADIYRLDVSDVAIMDMGGRRVGGTADKAFHNLRAPAAMELPLHVFVGSLGINMIGRSMAQTIVEAGFDSLDKMTRATPAQIAAIPGVGQTKADAFVDGFWDLLDRGVITDLLGVGLRIQKPKTGVLSGKSYCFTGFRDDTLEKAIEAQGGTIKSGVSKSLTVLVTKEANSTSGKAQTARKYGTEVIGVDEMWQRVGGKP
ncbi:MAG: hypothetical protein A2Y38_14010 [Spirochaetes bacterium GWB1_59_5]|nr:MAG: hypothetical protein A2Y38_14010 [Spirochaetes bacterium GWB1_59_5]